MSIRKIESSEELKQLHSETGTFFLMKNSTTCPVSSDAFTEMKAYGDTEPAVPVYYLNVQEAREVSNKVSEEFNVKHESPQLLLFKDQSVVWHTSHWHVTKENAEKEAKAL